MDRRDEIRAIRGSDVDQPPVGRDRRVHAGREDHEVLARLAVEEGAKRVVVEAVQPGQPMLAVDDTSGQDLAVDRGQRRQRITVELAVEMAGLTIRGS